MSKKAFLDIHQESPEVREKINKAINEIVLAEVRKDDAASFIADVKERIEEETGMPKAQLSAYAKLRYMQEHQPQKYEAEKDWFDSCFEENELLRG